MAENELARKGKEGAGEGEAASVRTAKFGLTEWPQ